MILVPNQGHRLDAPAYKKRYPALRVFAPSGGRESIAEVVPDPVKELQRHRIILTGEIPSPSHKPAGCVFHQRCPIAIEACKETDPALEAAPGDSRHRAACILA